MLPANDCQEVGRARLNRAQSAPATAIASRREAGSQGQFDQLATCPGANATIDGERSVAAGQDAIEIVGELVVRFEREDVRDILVGPHNYDTTAVAIDPPDRENVLAFA